MKGEHQFHLQFEIARVHSMSIVMSEPHDIGHRIFTLTLAGLLLGACSCRKAQQEETIHITRAATHWPPDFF
jgi:hypothetical protein